MSGGSDHAVRIALDLPASPEQVYRAWTDPAWLARWFGDNVEADIRIGGRYRAENRDGDTVYVHEGEYLALEPGRLVRATFGVPNSPATDLAFSDEFIEARLEPSPGGTRLRFTNGWNGDPIGADGEAAVRSAWEEWLGQLAKALRQQGEAS